MIDLCDKAEIAKLRNWCKDLQARLDTLWQKAEAQPKPQTWRDVTAECELSRFSRITHQGNYVDGHIDGQPLDDYRVRKVTVRKMISDYPDTMQAFIIERKDT